MHHSACSRNHSFAKFTLAALCAFVLGIALFASPTFAADNGDPFIITTESCQLTLTPATADVQVNGTLTLTATLSDTGLARQPVSNADYCLGLFARDSGGRRPLGTARPLDEPDNVGTIDFDALSGPNAGLHSRQDINFDTGQAQYTYSSSQAGPDVWRATAYLPDTCHVDDSRLRTQTLDEGGYDRWNGDIPSDCVEDYCWDHFFDTGGDWDSEAEAYVGGDVDTDRGCGDIVTPYYLDSIGPPVKLQARVAAAGNAAITSNQSSVSWTALPPVAVPASPSVRVASNKKCHRARKFQVRSAGYNGTVASTTIFIDGKKTRAINGSGKAIFTLKARRYDPGRHSVIIATTFTNGATVTTTSSFRRCPIKVAHAGPRFTG